MMNVQTLTSEMPAVFAQDGQFAVAHHLEETTTRNSGRRVLGASSALGVMLGGLVLLGSGCGSSEPELETVGRTEQPGRTEHLGQTEQLGKAIFNDVNLSLHRNQSCAACHDLAWGTTGSVQAVNTGGAVYEGSVPGQFGNRKPPASAYATISPVLSFDAQRGFVGGNFWDGRATGLRLGNPAMDQAQGPFLNPVEQALPDAACIVYRVATAAYRPLYRKVWGNTICTIHFPVNTDALCAANQVVELDAADRAKVNLEYDNIARAIAAWEASDEVSAYTSKFDAWRAGTAMLSAEEERGWALFNGKGKCAHCHVPDGHRPAFTDFTYDNLGIPKNPANPVYATDPGFVDTGLGGFLMSRPDLGPYEPELGKFKVPTLRNVDRRPAGGGVKAYMHNGVFKSLREVVHFYNTRDVLPGCETTLSPRVGVNCWPAPELTRNLNVSEVGNLGLSAVEENALVAFLTTLSDGYIER
jgi:cytochrome c peroxidase